MKHVTELKCTICGKTYTAGEIDYVCPDHGDNGIVDIVYDYDVIRSNISRESLALNREPTIWRYKPMIAVSPDFRQ